MGVEVVVGGEDAGTEELFLEGLHEVEEVLGLAAADVIDGIGDSLSPALSCRRGSSDAEGFYLLQYIIEVVEDFLIGETKLGIT